MATSVPYHVKHLLPARTRGAKKAQALRASLLGTVQCGERVAWTGTVHRHTGVVVYSGKRRWAPHTTRDQDWLTVEDRAECVAAPRGRRHFKRWGPLLVKTADGHWYAPRETRLTRLTPLAERKALIRYDTPEKWYPPPPVPTWSGSTGMIAPHERDENDEPNPLHDPDALRLLDGLFDE